MAQFHPPPSSTQVTASPLPSRSSINQNHATGKQPFSSYGQYPQNKHLQNLAKPTIPPQVPQSRQSSSNSLLNLIPSTIENSNKANSNNSVYFSNDNGIRVLGDKEHSLQQIPSNIQQTNPLAASKPLYQPDVIRIDCGSTNHIPTAPSPSMKNKLNCLN